MVGPVVRIGNVPLSQLISKQDYKVNFKLLIIIVLDKK